MQRIVRIIPVIHRVTIIQGIRNITRCLNSADTIRPTDLNRMPIAIKEQLPRDLFRLYQLIWKRFVASRMSAAQYDTTSVKIQAKDQIFTLAWAKDVSHKRKKEQNR